MFLQHPQQLVIVNSLINEFNAEKKLNVCFYKAIGQMYAIRIRADEHG